MPETKVLSYECAVETSWGTNRTQTIVKFSDEGIETRPIGVICENFNNGLCNVKVKHSGYNPKSWMVGGRDYGFAQERAREKVIKDEGLRTFFGKLKGDEETYIKPKVEAEIARLHAEALAEFEKNKWCIFMQGFKEIPTKPTVQGN